MTSALLHIPSFSNARAVFLLFLLPIGGGIPAGVLLAKTRGIHWIITAFLYFVSDVVLATAFEPLMRLFVRVGKRSRFYPRLMEAFRQSMKRTVPQYGTRIGPLALILVAFGVDPMTGRAATAAAGYGFFTGWMLAITGDMLYFGLIMASTLWLNGILGDGTWTTLLILAGMIFGPAVIKRIRERFGKKKPNAPSQSPSSST